MSASVAVAVRRARSITTRATGERWCVLDALLHRSRLPLTRPDGAPYEAVSRLACLRALATSRNAWQTAARERSNGRHLRPQIPAASNAWDVATDERLRGWQPRCAHAQRLAGRDVRLSWRPHARRHALCGTSGRAYEGGTRGGATDPSSR